MIWAFSRLWRQYSQRGDLTAVESEFLDAVRVMLIRAGVRSDEL